MSLTCKNRALVLISLLASSMLWVSGCVGLGKAAPSQPPNSGVTLVTVAPSKASSVTSGTLSFIATTQGTSSNTSVTWKALLGTITSAGVYTAPSKAGTDTVTAISVADPTKTSSSSITVTTTVANPQVTSIVISPTTAQVATSGPLQFASTVQGSTTDKSVRWTASLGTINSAGNYTAPTSAGNDTVTAISNADSSKTAAAKITVSAPVTTPSQSASCNGTPCPAFPGAAGGGAGSVGGRGRTA